MDIRCIVTGQNESGKSVFMRNTSVKPVTLALFPGYEFHRLWGSDSVPEPPSDATTSSPAFAKPAATSLHSAIRNQPAPPRSPSRMTRSAQPRTAAERRIAAPVVAGLWRLASSPTPWSGPALAGQARVRTLATDTANAPCPLEKMATERSIAPPDSVR